MPRMIALQRIWDRAEHNALTDLIFFRNVYYCCFRESDMHAEGKDGKIRILSSKDGVLWTSVALISRLGVDLRDPMLSEMPDGRLMLLMGGSVYKNQRYETGSPRVAFSLDGSTWGPIVDVNMPGEWIWRVTWHQGIGYGASYSFTDPKDLKKPWRVKLFKTIDGLHYTLVTPWDISNRPNETTLRFLESGEMVAMVRRDGNGLIGSAAPPYERWHWFETRFRFGGPNFLILPNGKMWAGSRLTVWHQGKRHFYTCLASMGLDEYQPMITLPSGGDTSYPGLVYRDGLLRMSYYSSHEGKAIIYLATVDLEIT